jgi:hypothetical protein
MADKKRYKVVNDTIKAPRLNSRGQDTRSLVEKVGHAVQFYVGTPAVLRTLYQNKSVIVDDLPEGILKFHSKGLVKIEVIEDIADELRNFAKKPIAEKPVEAQGKTTLKAPEASAPLKAKASLSGEHKAVDDTPVYTDGEPNFVAKAPAGGLKKGRKAPEPDAEPKKESDSPADGTFYMPVE